MLDFNISYKAARNTSLWKGKSRDIPNPPSSWAPASGIPVGPNHVIPSNANIYLLGKSIPVTNQEKFQSSKFLLIT